MLRETANQLTSSFTKFIRKDSPSTTPTSNITTATNMSNPTSTTSKSTSSCLVLLFKLIEANDWQKINSMFLTDPEGRKTFQYLAALVAKSSSFNGMTILHACARFNPPSLLLSKMIELCPDAPASKDCLNRTPLHVAAGTRASSSVIKVLVNAHTDACMVQDQDGRTPLHMACDNSCELFEDNNRSSSRGDDFAPLIPPPSYRTIGLLLTASIDSAILEDEDGMSAIEYALFSNADLQTVRLIQKAAQKVMLTKADAEKAERSVARNKSISGNVVKDTKDVRNRTQAAAAKGFKGRGHVVSARMA